MTRKTIFAAVFAALAALVEAAQPKNVILFIGDGMGVAQRMVAETYSKKTGGGSLAINTMPNHSTTTTHSASSLVTDSAAAVTAIACGEKTNNGMLGVLPSGERLTSVAEVAKASGRKVGIVTTTTIVHATPAGFYAHRRSRGELYRIALDLVGSGFDYFAGGGFGGKHDDRKDPEYRGNIFDLARTAGYAVTTNRSDWEALRPGVRSLNVFSDRHLGFAIDRLQRRLYLRDVAEGVVVAVAVEIYVRRDRAGVRPQHLAALHGLHELAVHHRVLVRGNDGREPIRLDELQYLGLERRDAAVGVSAVASGVLAAPVRDEAALGLDLDRAGTELGD